jgi:sterol desaturase/sphingolipid hydroxylase (fatty acid hydroxylase superfamily)
MELGAWFLAFQTGKYLLLSALPFLALEACHRRGLLRERRLHPQGFDPRAVRRDLGWSMLTFATEAVAISAIAWAGFFEAAPLYDRIGERGWLYFAASLAGLFVFHDAYFYWTHRLLHVPFLLRHVHRVHHLSRMPSALTAFSFHPIEGLIQFGVLLPAVVLLPIHPLAYLAFSVASHVGNTLGHLGYDLMPARVPFFQGAPDHDLHHSAIRTNFGLYFPFWDKVMGTRRVPNAAESVR